MSESHAPESHTPPSGSARLNTGVAHNARVWNYWIGGKDNYEVDRRVGDHVASIIPVIRDIARADRDFLGRAVTYLSRDRGVRQYLDIGTGLRVLAVLQKRRTDLTEDDAGVMWEVVDAVDAQRGPGHGPAAEDPARRRRLMALGHDPLRA